MKKISYYDLTNTPITELKKQHNLSSQDLEKQVRRHMDGAKDSERKQLYKSVYEQKKD